MTHEYLHQLIFAKYGIESNVTYNFGPAFKEQLQDVIHFRIIDDNMSLLDKQPMAWTTPAWNTTGECTETCRLLHTQVEISDNQTENIVQVLFLFAILWLAYQYFSEQNIKRVYVYEKKDKEDEEDEEPRFNIETRD
jgi:hypothetical protein